MAYVGGLRNRLIRDSLFFMLENALDDLGWMNTGPEVDPDITIRIDEFDEKTEIKLNTIAISTEVTDETEAETGSNLGIVTTTFYVDFYAQDDSLGKHLILDVKDILAGRFASIGRISPILEVYDYTMATPPHIFTCQIQDIQTDKARNFPNSWQQHWHVCRFDVEDSYESDAD